MDIRTESSKEHALTAAFRLYLSMRRYTAGLGVLLILSLSSMVSNGNGGMSGVWHQDYLPLFVIGCLCVMLAFVGTAQNIIPSQAHRKFHHIVPITVWSCMACVSAWLLFKSNHVALAVFVLLSFAVHLWFIYRQWAVSASNLPLGNGFNGP